MSEDVNAELLDSINKVLDEVVDRAALQDFANGRGDLESRLWRQAADLGWLGVGLPEEHGGLGLGASGIASLQQALGAHLAPGPYLSSMAGWQTLSECADAGLKANVFSDRGPQAVCVPATPMASHPVGLRLVDGRVSGQMDHVLGSAWSPWALVPVQAASDGRAWALVAIDGARASLTVQPTWDLTRSLCRLACDGAQATLLQQPFDRVRETLCAYLNLAVGFDCVGGATALLDETVAYMKGRSQFDRTIASFQALKHRVAKMHIELEMCQQAVSHALAMAEIGRAHV